MSVTKILASLEPLFRSATENHLWFHCAYQDIWLSPEELRAAQSEGRFIWSAKNWTLRDPQEQIDYLERRIDAAKINLEIFKNRVKAAGGLS